MWLSVALLCLLFSLLPSKPAHASLQFSVLACQPFVMKVPIDATDKCEIHVVIQFFFNPKGVKLIEIHHH